MTHAIQTGMVIGIETRQARSSVLQIAHIELEVGVGDDIRDQVRGGAQKCHEARVGGNNGPQTDSIGLCAQGVGAQQDFAPVGGIPKPDLIEFLEYDAQTIRADGGQRADAAIIVGDARVTTPDSRSR